MNTFKIFTDKRTITWTADNVQQALEEFYKAFPTDSAYFVEYNVPDTGQEEFPFEDSDISEEEMNIIDEEMS